MIQAPRSQASTEKPKAHFQTSLETKFVPLSDISPSPENDTIYGAIDVANVDLINLANDIGRSGVREPLGVSMDGYIVSGHRRYAAAKLVGADTVPIRVLNLRRSAHTAIEWQKALRAHNHQRVKPAAVRMKEAMLDIDPDIAFQQLVAHRAEIDRDAPPQIVIRGTKTRSEISDRKQPMLQAAIKVINGLSDFWALTVRQVHYGLLNDPPLRNASSGSQRSVYQNDLKSYSDLCDLLARARLLDLVPWAAIKDETRPVSGLRYSQDAATFFDLESHHFLRNYSRDLMQSQSDHIELIVEKLTVQSIVEPIARKFCLPMTVGRGYCSLDPRYEIYQRFSRSGKDRLKLLIVSDFDPDGEEIAESFARSIRDDFEVDDVTASKILLRKDQAESWALPHNGLEAKKDSSNYKKFMDRYANDQVYELEAVPPRLMQRAIQEAIEGTIDVAAFNKELTQEKQDAVMLQAIKNNLQDSFLDLSGNGFDGSDE